MEELPYDQAWRTPEKEEELYSSLQRMLTDLKHHHARVRLPYANDLSMKLFRLIGAVDDLMDYLDERDDDATPA